MKYAIQAKKNAEENKIAIRRYIFENTFKAIERKINDAIGRGNTRLMVLNVWEDFELRGVGEATEILKEITVCLEGLGYVVVFHGNKAEYLISWEG